MDKYIWVKEDTDEELVRKVNAYARQGYVPLGGPMPYYFTKLIDVSIDPNAHSLSPHLYLTYVQAMVLEEKPE